MCVRPPRWKTEPSFSPELRDGHLCALFITKTFKMFSRLDGSSRCVAAPSASWQPQFSFWNVNKAVLRAGWQAWSSDCPHSPPLPWPGQKTFTYSYVLCFAAMAPFKAVSAPPNIPVFDFKSTSKVTRVTYGAIKPTHSKALMKSVILSKCITAIKDADNDFKGGGGDNCVIITAWKSSQESGKGRERREEEERRPTEVTSLLAWITIIIVMTL